MKTLTLLLLVVVVSCVTAPAQVDVRVGPPVAPRGCPITITIANDTTGSVGTSYCPFRVLDENLVELDTPPCIGLFVTINSDDPPKFSTTLTEEFLQIAKTFDLQVEAIEQLVLNGAEASFLQEQENTTLSAQINSEFLRLREEHL